MDATNLAPGTQKVHVMAVRTGKCTMTYPGLKYDLTGGQAFCARQSAGGKLSEPRTETDMEDLEATLKDWEGWLPQ